MPKPNVKASAFAGWCRWSTTLSLGFVWQQSSSFSTRICGTKNCGTWRWSLQFRQICKSRQRNVAKESAFRWPFSIVTLCLFVCHGLKVLEGRRGIYLKLCQYCYNQHEQYKQTSFTYIQASREIFRHSFPGPIGLSSFQNVRNLHLLPSLWPYSNRESVEMPVQDSKSAELHRRQSHRRIITRKQEFSWFRLEATLYQHSRNSP